MQKLGSGEPDLGLAGPGSAHSVSWWRTRPAARRGTLPAPARDPGPEGNSCNCPLEAELLGVPDQILGLIWAAGNSGEPWRVSVPELRGRPAPHRHPPVHCAPGLRVTAPRRFFTTAPSLDPISLLSREADGGLVCRLPMGLVRPWGGFSQTGSWVQSGNGA